MTTPLPTGAIVAVVGVSNYQAAVRSVAVGQPVCIRHDFTNAYDRWAVAVTLPDGTVLGYLPAKGGLARRLSEHTPGGRWSGVITDVLDGPTCGIRVRLGELTGIVDPKPGSDVDGIRDRGHGADLPAAAPVDVFTTYGRRVGVLKDVGQTLTTVIGDDGIEMAYPTSTLAPVATIQPGGTRRTA